jgi:hypothetical protein
MSDEQAIIAEYRGLLTTTEQKSQADFDKAILALSGGALGISFIFLKDIIGKSNAIHIAFLVSAWIGWTLSATCVLCSFFTSILALRQAIHQLDRGTIGMERPGKGWDCATTTLNAMGLILFVSALAMMIVFLSCNLKIK